MLQHVSGRTRKWLLGLAVRVRGGNGSLLASLPEATLTPLRRDGLDPLPSLGALRDRSPVSLLRLPLGLRGWLVSGYDEARAVLSDTTSFSNDYSHVVGTVGASPTRDPGGLGMADAPHHTRLRRLLTPEFTGHRLARLQSRIDEIVDEQLDLMAAATDVETAPRAPPAPAVASNRAALSAASAVCSEASTPRSSVITRVGTGHATCSARSATPPPAAAAAASTSSCSSTISSIRDWKPAR